MFKFDVQKLVRLTEARQSIELNKEQVNRPLMLHLLGVHDEIVHAMLREHMLYVLDEDLVEPVQELACVRLLDLSYNDLVGQAVQEALGTQTLPWLNYILEHGARLLTNLVRVNKVPRAQFVDDLDSQIVGKGLAHVGRYVFEWVDTLLMYHNLFGVFNQLMTTLKLLENLVERIHNIVTVLDVLDYPSHFRCFFLCWELRTGQRLNDLLLAFIQLLACVLLLFYLYFLVDEGAYLVKTIVYALEVVLTQSAHKEREIDLLNVLEAMIVQ